MKGILCLNKPSGESSAKTVSRARAILGVKKIGHMGTLDPAGRGVLLLGVGKATRLFDFFLDKDKVYEAEFAFGYETDTLDAMGKITEKTDVIPRISEIKKAAEKFIGKISQYPPKYSAKSIGGIRAYELARNGIDFELKPAEIQIYSIDVLDRTAENTYLFKIHCSSGTYIRSLCRDIAYETNSLATMISICRTRCGNFTLSDAVTLSELEELKQAAIIPIEQALKDVQIADLSDRQTTDLLNGKSVECEPFDGLKALMSNGELIALISGNDGKVRLKTYLRD